MKRATLAALLRDQGEGRAVVLVTDLAGGDQLLVYPLEGSSAQSDGEPPSSGGVDLDAERHALAARAVREDRALVAPLGETDHLFRPFNPPVRVVLVGAVHIAQALAPMTATAGFQVVVVDPRSAWASEFRFPGVRVEQGWPDAVLPALSLDHRTAVVTLTHDPKVDDPALLAALESPAFYVGALGSRRTHERRVARLREKGVAGNQIERIRAPVGLDIGARTPAEIAVSALAEIVSALRRPESD